MQALVRDHGQLPHDQAMIVCSWRKPAISCFLEARPTSSWRGNSPRWPPTTQKLALMRCLFDVSATDESISTAEEGEIHHIANELRIDPPDLVALRVAHRRHLPACRARNPPVAISQMIVLKRGADRSGPGFSLLPSAFSLDRGGCAVQQGVCAYGNKVNWWTASDTETYDERAQVLIDQYSEFMPLEGMRNDGRTTLPENLADLIGLRVALDAASVRHQAGVIATSPLNAFHYDWICGPES